MQFLKDFFYLFYPNLCLNCTDILGKNETLLCTFCRHDLPLTNFTSYTKNKIVNAFYGRVSIEKATSLLYFRKTSVTKNLIHALKYHGNQEVGVFFGNWLGGMLKENKEFKLASCIIPVPLHQKRLKERGYNQLTKFAETLSMYLEIPIINNALQRVYANKTQTRKNRFDRFTNKDTEFLVCNNAKLENHHVLLIDDVITTGATLEACAKALKKCNNVKISILTMAYTE